MCELFALSCSIPAGVHFSWSAFRKRGKDQRDGWGVGFYPETGHKRCAIIIKEPEPSSESAVARFLQETDFVKGKIIISHIRKSSGTGVTWRNTHPFQRELFGRDWVFAHNGTVKIKEDANFRLERFHPVGETDSEYAFCYLLERIAALKDGPTDRELTRTIQDGADAVTRLGRGFNFLLADGNLLFVYWSGYSKLHYLLRHPPHVGQAQLKDEDFSVALSEMKGANERAVVVATQPLTNETGWKPLPRRRLLVLRDGRIVSLVTL